MVDYILFFGLILVGVICFLIGMKQKPNKEVLPRFVEEFNKCESPIERRLFKALWYKDHQVTCQYPFGHYRLDFAIPEIKLCIEADGAAYHSSPEQKAKDKRRDAYLKSKGWKTLRFSGSQINGNMSQVIKKIETEIEKRYSV